MSRGNTKDTRPPASQEAVVSPANLYATLAKAMSRFEFRPGERLNEGAIARKLGVSRTPVREALSKLVVAGVIDHEPGVGFVRRQLDPKEIFDLYELRQQIEVSGVGLAVERATDRGLSELEDFLKRSIAVDADCSPDTLVDYDEQFHEAVIGLTGNAEMLRTLRQINARIRYIRWIDMRGRRQGTQEEHRRILEMIRSRDAASGCLLMEAHVKRRLEQIVDAVREGYASIYMGDAA